MEEMEYIKIMRSIEETEQAMNNALKYIHQIEATRPLTEKEKILKRCCSEMWGTAATNIQTIDLNVIGDAN